MVYCCREVRESNYILATYKVNAYSQKRQDMRDYHYY